jgi:hypothetical protein
VRSSFPQAANAPFRLIFARDRNTIDGMHCGILEVAHVEDAAGYPCGRDASSICLDCGTHLCDAPAENCEVCSEVFCATCLVFHSRANHRKNDALWAEIAHEMKRKSA